MELQKKLDILELVFLKMSKELDRATPFNLDNEFHFVGVIGGNSLTLPKPNVLLKNTFHSSEINLGDSGDMVDLQRNLDPNSGSDLGSEVFGRRRRRRL